MHSRSGSNRCLLRAGVFGLLIAAVVSSGTPAFGQYAFDETADHEQEGGIRYFGSAKDASGKLLEDVTILLEDKSASYIFVTDSDGRFRGYLPSESVAGSVSAKCSKAGFSSVKVTKRPGPAGARPTVQVDCVLRSADSPAS